MKSAMASAMVSFVVVFAIVFVLAGLFLMPHLPPTPRYPVTAFELEFWTTNWAGAALGILLGGLSARSILKRDSEEVTGGQRRILPSLPLYLFLAQSSVSYEAARRGTELSQWASGHRALLAILGAIVLIAIFVFVARMRRDS